MPRFHCHAELAEGVRRARLEIKGMVQGVGFRPYVFRLASELGLRGWTANTAQGLRIEIEGSGGDVETFLCRLPREKPPHSSIQSLETFHLDPANFMDFEIRPSESDGELAAFPLPEIATCPDCLRELFDPANRRYRYPFINCTHCGPRYSIIERLPYDRANTSMKKFDLCSDCRKEYDNPADRRFHAQPNACAVCGPQIELWNRKGQTIAGGEEALQGSVDLLRNGAVLALKGVGGFHLLCNAQDDRAVLVLRERKGRAEKPLALMFPSLEEARQACQISPLEERALLSSEAPIVLLRKNGKAERLVSAQVAPSNPWLGVMLPYTPLHHLLLRDFGGPVVATSGNAAEETICFEEQDALLRLRGIADAFLVHDRPILRHADDSIVRIAAGREMVLRRARGMAPLPISAGRVTKSILSVGGQMKNTVGITVGDRVVVSPHLGDLENASTVEAFERTVVELQRFFKIAPAAVAADAHPDYYSRRWARRSGLPVNEVQHHYAHALACLAENEVIPPALAVVWDGTGYGPDGTIWGGEFLEIMELGFSRRAHFRAFALPGGEKAIREPRRSALGLLHGCFGSEWRQHFPALEEVFSQSEIPVLARMLERGLNAPLTSSAGRLFDAAASLAGVRQSNSYEGQAAMELEFALEEQGTLAPYYCALNKPKTGPLTLDWAPVVLELVADRKAGRSAGAISWRFHEGLAQAILQTAAECGIEKLLLTGGCFQNSWLLERSIFLLRQQGFRVYWPQRLPPNDGGLAFGQAVAAQICV